MKKWKILYLINTFLLSLLVGLYIGYVMFPLWGAPPNWFSVPILVFTLVFLFLYHLMGYLIIGKDKKRLGD